MFYMTSFKENFDYNVKDLICYDCNRPVTRNVLGQESFLGIRPLWSTIMYKTRKKGPAGKNPRIFLLQTRKYCILNEKFNPLMITIRALLHHQYCIISERFLDIILKKFAKHVSTKQITSRQQIDKITSRGHQEFRRTTCNGRPHMVLYVTPSDVLYRHPEYVPYCCTEDAKI